MGEEPADCWPCSKRGQVIADTTSAQNLTRAGAVVHAERHAALGRNGFEGAGGFCKVLIVG